MRISGAGFGADEPDVTLEGLPMVVVSHDPTEIVIDMPPGLAPATYLLTVAQFEGDRRLRAEFEVTVGAEGPQGPQGAPGAQGRKGRSGRRALGSDGAAGRHGRTRAARRDWPDRCAGTAGRDGRSRSAGAGGCAGSNRRDRRPGRGGADRGDRRSGPTGTDRTPGSPWTARGNGADRRDGCNRSRGTPRPARAARPRCADGHHTSRRSRRPRPHRRGILRHRRAWARDLVAHGHGGRALSARSVQRRLDRIAASGLGWSRSERPAGQHRRCIRGRHEPVDRTVGDGSAFPEGEGFRRLDRNPHAGLGWPGRKFLCQQRRALRPRHRHLESDERGRCAQSALWRPRRLDRQRNDRLGRNRWPRQPLGHRRPVSTGHQYLDADGERALPGPRGAHLGVDGIPDDPVGRRGRRRQPSFNRFVL